MEVRCDKCQARYRVDDGRIGPQGLTMRCGKCQNTFKVTRPDALPATPEQAPVAPGPRTPPAAAKPAAKPVEPAPNATMVFGQSPVAASKPAMPSASSRPAASAARPPAAKPAAAAPADEGAGRTMMFQTGNLKTSAPAAAKPVAPKPASESGATMAFGQSPAAARAAPPAKPAGKPAQPDAGSTMVFGQAPLAKPAATAMPKPSAAAKPASRDDSAGSTMMFGASPAPAKPTAPARPAPAAAPEPEPEPEAAAPDEAAPEPQHEDAAAHEEAPPADEAATDSGVEAEGAEESAGAEAPADQGAFDKAPPKGLLIGVAAGLAALLLAGGALVAVKKLGRHAPPPAAVETLSSAQADADKDSLASIASAEGKTKDAIDVAGKSYFPEANATLARIEVQWADALYDQAAVISARAADGSEAKAAELQTQAKARLKAAFEALSPALKADPRSPELQVSLADYYRAQRSNSNMNKALKSAQALKADDARVSLVQGMAILQEDDGAEKAIPKLKAALLANPNSARVHFRLALAYQAMKDDANASAELKQVLKLSPQHERAKLLLETTASADGK